MLKFIGNGSAFNTQYGNNSAYFKQDGILFLIDCGSSVFRELHEKKILEDVEKIYVLVTHTHADHVGSLGDLILYSYYSMGKLKEKNLTVITGCDTRIKTLLNLMGVTEENYNLHYLDEFESSLENQWIFHIEKEKCQFTVTDIFEVNHVEELTCYGYELNINSKKIYYSGDCYEIPSDKLKKINSGYYDYVYQDTSKADYEGNVHLSLKKLNASIVKDKKIRNKIYCMHLDSVVMEDEIEYLGFNVTQIID